MEAGQFGPWSDLQPELLGLVLKRLPSLADRVRLRAVCHPWRSNSTLKALPFPFPWLTLPDGTFLSIPGSEIHRMPLPEGARCHGSIDNRLFLVSSDGAFSLLNPFSKATLELPNLVTVWQSEIDSHAAHTPHDPAVSYKLVAPSPLDSSPKSLAAALITGTLYSLDLCMIQPPAATYSFRGISTEAPPILVDFALFDGRLYVVSEFTLRYPSFNYFSQEVHNSLPVGMIHNSQVLSKHSHTEKASNFHNERLKLKAIHYMIPIRSPNIRT